MTRQKNLSIWKTPQYSVAIFVLISAFTTGLGMTESFFDGNFLCGLGVSIGIQLLLVWMGWRTPKLFSQGNRIARILLIVMYCFTVLWSTGFSFVYVCNHIYSSVSMRDDQSLLADTYRKNMIDLKKRVDVDFDNCLEDVMKQIVTLQTKAQKIDNGMGTIENESIPDFSSLKTFFADNAKVYQAIVKVENIAEGKSVGNMSALQDAIREAVEEIEENKRQITENIEKNKNRTDEISEEIKTLAGEKYYYSRNTTIDNELEKQIQEKDKEKGKLIAENESLNDEYKGLEKYQKEIKEMQNYIEAKAGSTEGVLNMKFAEILGLLGESELRIDLINKSADDIYEELTKSIQTDGGKADYTEILNAYLSFQASLKKLENIRKIQEFCQQDTTVIEETEVYVTSFPPREEKEIWKKKWDDAFIVMKSNYYLLPSASDEAVLEKYDNITWLQRCLLTDLGGIERAKYYLSSAHPLLAWLSFGLALFLDLMPVLLMIVKLHVKKTEDIPLPQLSKALP